jgi:hypothetical protein
MIYTFCCVLFTLLSTIKHLHQRPLSILGFSSNTQISGTKRGTSEYSRALAAIL